MFIFVLKTGTNIS